MTAIRQILDDYLALRRDLGYKLLSPLAQRCCRSLASWRRPGPNIFPGEQRRHLGLFADLGSSSAMVATIILVRGFARYCVALDPRTEVPPADLLPYRYQRRAPFFFFQR